ncbi:hypothetical protein WA158_002012 [Blastocystis sp. Blastoise]
MAEQAAEQIKKYTITITGPQQEKETFIVAGKEAIFGLKQRLETCFQFSCYTAYHFVYETIEGSLVLDNDQIMFEEIPSLKDTATFTLKVDEYDAGSIKEHISHFIGLLTNKVALQGQLLKYQNSELPEVLQKLEKKLDEAEKKEAEGKKEEDPKSEVNEFAPIKATEEELQHDLDLAEIVKKQNVPTSVLYKNFLDIHDALNNHIGSNKTQSYCNRCVLDIWNPPKQSRKLLGDLIYLRLTTKEELVFHITGCNEGFYVNQSTDSTFNAGFSSIYPNMYPTLAALFSAVSRSFRSTFYQLCAKNTWSNNVDLEELINSLHVMPVNEEKSKGWFMNEDIKNDPLDMFSEMSRYGHIEALQENNKNLKDWETDYVMLKNIEMDESARLCCLIEKENSFTIAAKEGVLAIVDEGVAPINDVYGDSPCYILNGVFYSTVLDTPSAPINRASANDEIASVRSLNQFNVNGLNTLLTCVVDYKGYRFLAQGLIPGLLQKTAHKMIMYGTLDDGKTIYNDKVVLKAVEELSKDFYWKQGTVYPQGPEGEEEKEGEQGENGLYPSPAASSDKHVDVKESISFAGPVDGRIVKGCDDRLYIMDFLRAQPIDILWKQDCIKERGVDGYGTSRVLRRELLQHWNLRRAVVEKQIEMMKQRIEDDAKDTKEKTEEAKKNIEDMKAQIPKLEQILTEMPTSFDVNTFTVFSKSLQQREEIEKDTSALKTTDNEKDVIVLNNFLRSEIIPSFIEQVMEGSISCPDGEKLTSTMHANGINMRYLGVMADLVNKVAEKNPSAVLSNFMNILEVEMIARASKHILSQFLTLPNLKDCSAYLVAAFFNALVKKDKSNSDILIEGVKTTKKSKKAGVRVPAKVVESLTSLGVTPAGIWDLLQAKIQELYHYHLVYWSATDGSLRIIESERLSLIRRVSQQVGVVIKAATYNLNIDYVFTPEDILSFIPQLKIANTPNAIMQCQQLYSTMEEYLEQMNLIPAFKICHMIIFTILTTHGLLHPMIIRCLSSMAAILFSLYIYLSLYIIIIYLYSLHDYKSAIKYQRIALNCCDRLIGVDSLDSALCHATLSTYLSKSGCVIEAMLHCRLALDVYIMSSGLYSENTLLLMIKLGICYRDLGIVDKSLASFIPVLSHLDKKSTSYPLALREVSLTYIAKKDFTNGIKYEKQYCQWYKEQGEKDDSNLVSISNQLVESYEKEMKN